MQKSSLKAVFLATCSTLAISAPAFAAPAEVVSSDSLLACFALGALGALLVGGIVLRAHRKASAAADAQG
jgi:hypothetical protein